MSIITRRYWVGTEGPFLQEVDTDNPITPFRFESIEEAQARSAGRGETGISVRRGESGREESVVTTKRIGPPENGVTDHDPITAERYSAYRAAHFNSFLQGNG